MTPEEIRRRSILARMQRNEKAQFNEPSMPNQAALQATIAKQRLGDYQRFGAGGNGVVLNQLPAAPDTGGDTAADVARKAAMDKMRLVGRQGGVSEVAGGTPETRQPLQAQFADPRALAARARQGNEARSVAMNMVDKGIQRPTRESQNAARMEKKLSLMQRMNSIQAAPTIAMIQAQHTQDPTKQAEANYYRAAVLEKLIASGVPLDQAMNHPLMQGGQSAAPQQQRMTPGELRAQTLDNVPGVGPAYQPSVASGTPGVHKRTPTDRSKLNWLERIGTMGMNGGY